MASNAKNLAELLNTDSTVAVGDIADGSVSTAKLADDAVTTAKIGAGAVGTTEIADDAVTSAKSDGSVAIGKNVIIKPNVNIKYPWKLQLGDHVWIGEGAWIDNLDSVIIGDHCCVSQGALLICGNHDYTKITFDLVVKPIVLEDGVWIGAKSVVCPGVVARTHAILTAGSTISKDMQAYSIYRGNPAEKVKSRDIKE